MIRPKIHQPPADLVIAKHIAEFEYMWEELPTAVMEHYLDKAHRLMESLKEEDWDFISLLDTVEPTAPISPLDDQVDEFHAPLTLLKGATNAIYPLRHDAYAPDVLPHISDAVKHAEIAIGYLVKAREANNGHTE